MPRYSVEPNDRIACSVLYEDAFVAVLAKPAGVPTQPGKGHDADTLLNAAFARYGSRLQNLGAGRDFGLLHRLDKDASGALVIALTVPAYDALRAAFDQRRVRKYYWAIVKGAPARDRGLIDRPIAELAGARKTARISSAGKPAATAWRVLARGAGASLVECRALTGRLHQVRVHLASIHLPILGDRDYATEAVRHAAPRMALHAHRLVFEHPATDARVDAHAPLPRDLAALLRRAGLPKPDAIPDANQPDNTEPDNAEPNNAEPSITGLEPDPRPPSPDARTDETVSEP